MPRNISHDKITIRVDDDIKIVDYTYTFLAGASGASNRLPPAPKEKGWKTILVRRERTKTPTGHTWKTRYIFIKEKDK